MLRYLACGERDYGNRPVRPGPRERWELEGAVAGRIAPVLRGRTETLHERRLWILPPSCGHGWTGDGATATIVSLQPLRVPLAVERAAATAARSNRLLHWDMSLDDATWLKLQAEALMVHYAQADAVELLRQERLVLEVCIRALAALPAGAVEAVDDDPRRIVEAALAWFLDHLQDGVSEDDVAHAVHCSPAHLRRLFHRVYAAPPRHILGKRRLLRADELLVGSDLSLAAIAAACGFESASTFCRAYQRAFHRTPGDLRRNRPLVNVVDPPPGTQQTGP